MKTIRSTIVLTISLFLFSVAAISAPKVTLNVVAEKEVTVEENGKLIKKRMQAETAEQGEELIYTLNYANEGNEGARNVKMNNKFPENTTYVIESAWGEGAEIQFSMDGGKTFKDPSLLVYEVTGQDGKKLKKTATPEKYTDILWVVKAIPAGQSGSVGFKLKVN